MYVKTFEKSFSSQAITLRPYEVYGPCKKQASGWHQFTHSDGWTICGVVSEDYYLWVNDFDASHPTLGWVKGNFESEVRARSRKAYEDFVSKHEPHFWDYDDI
jgi:hypothetical protein